MRITPVLLFAFILSLAACTKRTADQSANPVLAELTARRVTLPNGWSLSPAGRSVPLGDFPMNLAVSASGKYLAVTHNGQSRQSIMLVDAAGEKVLSEREIPKAWLGLRFSPDERYLYASGGNDNRVAVYRVEGGQLQEDGEIRLGDPWPKNKISVAGIEVDPKRNVLYAVTKEDSALYTLDLTSRKITRRVKLPTEPYTCLLSPVRDELYVSLWGGEKVLVYNPADGTTAGEIPTESHPNDLVTTRDGKYLFVANANANSVSVIDVAGRKVLETISTALFPESPAGSTPNGVALSADEKTLYIANADNNCLAVFDVAQPGKSHPEGFIPTGWYPTAVRTVGNKIVVTNGKGFTSKANPKGPVPGKGRDENTEYIAALFKGTLSFIDPPDEKTRAAYSETVYKNTPYNKNREKEAEGTAGNPIPRRVGDPSPIKYVFYIVKENRTYDQVFGDMPEGNGDTSLCLFPERITPNHHALAREFVLLDNFYVDAEVSADGHNWSMAAYATDYVEKTWPTSYGARGGTYDYEGSRKVAFPKDGFIWDYCQRAGIPYRSYGEFEAYAKRGGTALTGHMAPGYPDYDLSIKDIHREEIWERDFDSLLAAGTVPRFSTVRMGNDHTSGGRVGAPTPFAHVADNDLALGRFVEHLSNSKIWGESAVFVVEDDAQNGPDHVDAHRSPALVISPWVRRRQVDHTMYSTAGILRTMELILGLPPMSQYDAAATPLWRPFTNKPDLATYTARPNTVDLNQKNTAYNDNARKSEEFNFAQADAIPDDAFSEVIWKTVKGERSVMPAPRRSAFIRPVGGEEEGEED
jgi:YVTN family beta-propeller protein